MPPLQAPQQYILVLPPPQHRLLARAVRRLLTEFPLPEDLGVLHLCSTVEIIGTCTYLYPELNMTLPQVIATKLAS